MSRPNSHAAHPSLGELKAEDITKGALMLKGWRERVTGTDLVMWLIGAGIVGMVIVGSVATLASGRYAGRPLV